jgi:hypothetical protein
VSEKSRIRNLSTRYLEFYRYGFALILTAFAGALLFMSVDDFVNEGFFSALYFPVFWGFMIFTWFKAHLKVFKVEFDDDYLYVIKKSGDVLIPLENVKDIEMKSLGGMWKVDLYYADIVGDHFYFKPSLLYPLNYRSKDKLVNILWQKIELAKQRRPPTQMNALHS